MPNFDFGDFGFDWGDYATTPDFGGGYDPRLDPGIPGDYDPRLDPGIPGDYDPRLDPNPGGAYDPRLDPNPPGGAYDPRLDPNAPGGGGPGTGFNLSDIVKGIPWSTLLPLIATIGGGLYARNRTNRATDQMQQAIAQANQQVTGILGGNQALFAPYQQAGLEGLRRLQAFPQSDLASRYRPLGTGAGMTLGALTGGR